MSQDSDNNKPSRERRDQTPLSLGCLIIFFLGMALVLLGTLFFYGFGSRIVDAYHVFEWNVRFGKIGEILAVVFGIFVLFCFWILSFLILAGTPVRYATYLILPVTLSFPIAFTLTPIGHQSFFVSVAVFVMWCLCNFVLIFFLVLSMKNIRAYRKKPPRKPLDTLPPTEKVSRKDLQNSKKYRAGLETFLEKCTTYGSVETFQKSKEYRHKYDIYVDDIHVMDSDMMVRCDVNIAIAEFCLTKNVTQFRHELAKTYQAQWEVWDHGISNFPTKNFPKVASAIFHSLAALDLKQAAIQAEYLSNAIRTLRLPLRYNDEAVYVAIIAAVQVNLVGLQRANERLQNGQKLFYRLFDNEPGYWLPYLTGLAEKNVSLCNEGIRLYAEEHHYRVFQDVDSQYYMNIQALGMANLCRIHGIAVAAIPPIVPEGALLNHDEKPDNLINECFRTNL